MRSIFVLLLFCSALVAPLAQEAPQDELRDGFRDLRLRMSVDEAKDALGLDPNFDYRGDPDVSLVPSTGTPIIQTAGVSFINRAILQFTEDRLYVLTLILDDRRLDYFSVFSEFSGRYGTPDSLNPDQAVWESDSVRISLERPLTVKYIDVELFSGIVEAGVLGDSLEEMTRERFLEQL